MDSVDFELIERAKEKIKAMQNEDIKFCDYIKLKKQLEKIEKSMVLGYFSCNISLEKQLLKFDLFNCECSTGKTFSVVTKAILFLEQWSIDIYEPKGMLFVMQNISSCKYYAKMINEDLLDNHIVAETVDSDMDDVEIENKLNRYPIIFLTHEKYKVLAQDEEQRKQFSKDRILLVIDEFINMSKKIWISNVEYEKFIVELKEDRIRENFREVTKELKEYFKYISTNGINRDKKLHITNFTTDYEKVSIAIEKIKEDVKHNLNSDELTDFFEAHHKRSIYNVLDEIKEFWSGTCILERGKLYTVKRNIQLWGLNKNIILDGSGTLNYAYHLQRDKINFRLEKDYRVLDHKNFIIEHIEINTTKTSKENYDNFYILCRQILKELNPKETLVVCARYERKNSKGQEKTEYFDVPFINYWQNFLGSNIYSNVKNMLVVDTFNLTEKDYILEYLYYSNIVIKDDEDIKVGTLNKHRHFINNRELEEYKNRRIANEFYQAFKRINRKLQYNSKIVVITQHTEALMLACNMLKNAEYYNITDKYDFVVKFKDNIKRKTSNSKDNDIKAIQILIKILNNEKHNINIEIKNNKIILQKQTLRNILGITKASNLQRDVLKKSNVKDFMEENHITETTRYLEIPIKT